VVFIDPESSKYIFIYVFISTFITDKVTVASLLHGPFVTVYSNDPDKAAPLV